jgi:hypothetical protein
MGMNKLIFGCVVAMVCVAVSATSRPARRG